MGIKDFASLFQKKIESNNQARIDEKYPLPDPRIEECDTLIKTLNEQFKKTNERLKAVK